MNFRSYKALREEVDLNKVILTHNKVFGTSYRLGQCTMTIGGIQAPGDPGRPGYVYIGSDYIGRFSLKDRFLIFDRNKDSIKTFPIDVFMDLEKEARDMRLRMEASLVLATTEEEREIARIRDRDTKNSMRNTLDSRKNRGESKRRAYLMARAREDEMDLLKEVGFDQPLYTKPSTEGKPMDALVKITCGHGKNSHRWETTKAEAIKFRNTCPEHRVQSID